MNTLIIGAGTIGYAIADLLSKEGYKVILVDKDPVRLEQAAQSLDIATHQGSGTSWKLLEELTEFSPDLFLALTDDDETNLVACAIAKGLGYPKTIARIGQSDFLNLTRLDFGRLFAVDHFIGPELMVAQEIEKYIIHLGAVNMDYFAHGSLQMRSIHLSNEWTRGGQTLAELQFRDLQVGLIHRETPTGSQLIFPQGKDVLLPGDVVTFIGQTQTMEDLHILLGLPNVQVRSVVIVGGSTAGVKLARSLQQRGIHVRIIDKDYAKCCSLTQQLPQCTIINHDATDLSFIEEERLNNTEVFVSMTGNDETNIVTAFLAHQADCPHVIAIVTDPSYGPLLNKVGISHTVSRTSSAANRILSLARAETIISTLGLYDNQARILELKVSMHSNIVGIPLAELRPHLPKDFLIAAIQNRGRVMVANGQRILSPGDTVIVVTSPKNMSELQQLF